MIGHSNETTDLGYLERLIDNGSYVGWDRCGLDIVVPLDDQLDTLAEMVRRGYADRLMLSQDKASFSDWFSDEETDSVAPNWQYTYITGGLAPQAARARGHRRPDRADHGAQPARLLRPAGHLRGRAGTGRRRGGLRCRSSATGKALGVTGRTPRG
jgi:hypothetical protein